MKIAVFPGSFDPITKGHVAVLQAALPLFDKVYVAIGVNADKSGFFPLEQRKRWIEKCFAKTDKVEVVDYNGLTVELCRRLGAEYIIRGVRNPSDFQYEKDIAQANSHLCREVKTLFFMPDDELSYISSSIVRDVFKHHGDCSDFLPEEFTLTV